MPTNSEIKMLFEQLVKASIEDDRRSSIDHLRFALLHAQTAENFSRRYNTSLKYDSVYVCIRQIIALLESDVQTTPEIPNENE